MTRSPRTCRHGARLALGFTLVSSACTPDLAVNEGTAPVTGDHDSDSELPDDAEAEGADGSPCRGVGEFELGDCGGHGDRADAGAPRAGDSNADAGDQGESDAGGDDAPSSAAPTVLCTQHFRSDAAGASGWFFGHGNQAVSNDAHGNTVVTGTFRGTLSWDGGSMTSQSNDQFMAFVVKLDSQCKVLWSRALTSSGYPGAAVAQQFDSDEVTLLVSQRPDIYTADWFVDESWHYLQRLSADGRDLWRTYVGADYRDEIGELGAVAVAPNGQVIMTGVKRDKDSFWPIAPASYVMRYDTSGRLLASEEVPELESARRVATSATGEFALEGEVFKAYGVGGKTADADGTQGENLVLLDGQGAYRWDRMLSQGLAGVNENSSVIIRGRPGHFVVAYDSPDSSGTLTIEDRTTQGELAWRAVAPGTASVDPNYVRAAPNGRVYFLADHQDPLEYGGKTFPGGDGKRHLVTGSFDTKGQLIRIDSFAPDRLESIEAGLGVDAQNHPVVLSFERIDETSLTQELVLTKLSH
ncbi:MAG: hypothetical protein QM778_17095 [Myxococcales bacterium]